MWPPRPLGCSPLTVLHQSPRMYPSEMDSGRSSGSTLCLSTTKPSQFSPRLDTPREDGPRRSALKCVFLLARTGLISFPSPHDLKPHHPRNRKDRLARTRKHRENEVIALGQTMVAGGRPISGAVGINTSATSLFRQSRPRARRTSEEDEPEPDLVHRIRPFLSR